MSDIDRYLNPELIEKAADIIMDALDYHGHNGIDCRPDAGMDLYVTAATRAALTAVLPDIIQQAKAEAWDEGHFAGHEDARAVQSTYPQPTLNPYHPSTSKESDNE